MNHLSMPGSKSSTSPATETQTQYSNLQLSDSTNDLRQPMIESGIIDPISQRLLKELDEYEELSFPITLSLVICLYAINDGHSCVSIEDLASYIENREQHPSFLPQQKPFLDLIRHQLSQLSHSEILDALISSSHISKLDFGDTEEELAPFVLLDKKYLFIQRFHRYERDICDNLTARVNYQPIADSQQIETAIDALEFPTSLTDAQVRAMLLPTQSPFTVISGGPGTGKTTCTARLFALIGQLAEMNGSENLPRILCLAPTGKAANRLSESLSNSVAQLNLSSRLMEWFPRTAQTIHKALGFQFRTPDKFRHHASSPLDYDWIVLDESSMVDLSLMWSLLEACSNKSRIIFLGDRDQLPSVEIGCIFSELYESSSFEKDLDTATTGSKRDLLSECFPRYSDKKEKTTKLPITLSWKDCFVHLTRSYRYEKAPGIGALAQACHQADADRFLELLQDDTHPDISWVTVRSANSPSKPSNIDTKNSVPNNEEAIQIRRERSKNESKLAQICLKESLESYDPYHAAKDISSAFETLDNYRLLLAHRNGLLSVNTFNESIKQLSLTSRVKNRKLHIQESSTTEAIAIDSRFRLPIIVTKTDSEIGVSNGDIAILDQNSDAALQAVFPSGPNLRRLGLGRVPIHEYAYALTIHKSQGSEYNTVAIVLRENSVIQSRELLYTAITRAKQSVRIYASENAIRQCLSKSFNRSSAISKMIAKQISKIANDS